MANFAGLQSLRAERFFSGWDEFVEAAQVAASEASVRGLIDELLAHGLCLSEGVARKAVDACVQRFNALDDGWISTIEREDIYEQIGRAIDLCGFEYGENWVAERDW